MLVLDDMAATTMHDLWEFWGAGLSLGEYCALVFAGVLSFEDGLRVVKARADSMAAAATLGEPSGPPPTCHDAHAAPPHCCAHQLLMH